MRTRPPVVAHTQPVGDIVYTYEIVAVPESGQLAEFKRRYGQGFALAAVVCIAPRYQTIPATLMLYFCRPATAEEIERERPKDASG